MTYLLDTCAVSELIAPKPNKKVIAWLETLEPSSVFLSVVTVGELWRGIERLPESKRKTILTAWFEAELLPQFSGQVLDLNVSVMLEWGELVARLEARGRKMALMDSLIAATALHHKLELVTRNEQDFAGSGVGIINPWS